MGSWLTQRNLSQGRCSYLQTHCHPTTTCLLDTMPALEKHTLKPVSKLKIHSSHSNLRSKQFFFTNELNFREIWAYIRTTIRAACTANINKGKIVTSQSTQDFRSILPGALIDVPEILRSFHKMWPPDWTRVSALRARCRERGTLPEVLRKPYEIIPQRLLLRY